MGCHKSILHLGCPQTSRLSSPTEEHQIQEFEVILLDSLYSSVICPLKDHSLSTVESHMKQIKSSTARKNLLSFDSAFDCLLSYYLIRPTRRTEKMQLILSLFQSDQLSFGEVSNLLDAILEVSTRVIPFMLFKQTAVNECKFFYYMSTLARIKKQYRNLCLDIIMEGSCSIRKSILAQTVLRNAFLVQILSTSSLRIKLWELSLLKQETNIQKVRGMGNSVKNSIANLFLITGNQENLN